MSRALVLESVRVAGRSGGNGRPVSGSAAFAGGAAFDWLVVPGGAIRWFSYRRSHGGTGRVLFAFDSPARSAALRSWLGLPAAEE